MSIDSDLITYLNTVIGVTALVGSPAQIAFESDIDNPSAEYVSVVREATETEYDFDGNPVVQTVTFEVNGHSTRNSESTQGEATKAAALGDAIEVALSGYKGVMGATPVARSLLVERDFAYDDDSGTHTARLVVEVLV